MMSLNADTLLESSPSALSFGSKDASEALFVPNGLLGESSTNLLQQLEEAAAAQRSTVVEGSNVLLVENGVASGLTVLESTNTTSNDVSSFQESQDDLPDTSVFIGLGLGRSTTLGNYAERSHQTHSNSSFIRATTFSGKSFHIKRKTRVENSRKSDTNVSGQRISGLLAAPIHRLMDELSAAAATSLDATVHHQESNITHVELAIEDTLWVDKYRPDRFLELIGNDRVARETMTWVKQWDWCVFGKKKGKKRMREDDENFNTEDTYHRPQQKLLLLSGPPGLGKTTLAHVIARQAGYEVMEINASDARSAQVVEDRIRPALESGTAVGGKKPVLLIIDEIDGATGGGDSTSGFVQKLVQLTFDKSNKKGRSGQKSNTKATRPILRPIICICNDANAASLAKLRLCAYQVRFTRPADIHTIRRLREICDMEGLKVDTRALSTLVGVTKGDLRGCLNTLQFIKSKHDEVSETVIRAATTGMKEADSSVTSVLNSLFAPLSRKRVNELGMTEDEELKYVERLSREVAGSGKEESVALGCFAHYANLRRHDANFSRYEKANAWLVAHDTLSSAMYASGDFALSPYLPYMVVPFYPLFQERGGERVERDQTDWDCLQWTRCNEEIYKSLARCIQTASCRTEGAFRHLVSTPIFQLEFAPYINRIISPPLRPVNSQVIKPDERALLSRLVNIMASLELRFVQERSEDGQLSYRLDPAIDVFVTYDGKRAADIAASRYAVRRLVATEIDALLIERQADAVEKENPRRFSKKSNQGKSSDAASGASKDTTDIADKPPTDFFGRLVTVQSRAATKAVARRNAEKKYRVTYRFTEGNSAAVRKPVKLATFL